VLSAIIWGLVQGLTEFLPISSSGHLVLVPAALSALGLETAEPSLLVSAVLHLGTLFAVLLYFRSDIARLFRFRSDPQGRRLWGLLILGTIPALIGLPLEGPL
jgi:undecaprenyl-diphosphatase